MVPGSVRCRPSTRMSRTVNGLKDGAEADCAEAWTLAASRHTAKTAAIPLRIISAGEYSVQIVVERKGHHDQQQREAHALPELHRALGYGLALDDFDRIIHQVPAVEQRDRQQVQHAEADADEREKSQVRDPAELRRL